MCRDAVSWRVGGICPPLTNTFSFCRGERRFEKSARRDGGMESGNGQVLKVIERWGED